MRKSRSVSHTRGFLIRENLLYITSNRKVINGFYNLSPAKNDGENCMWLTPFLIRHLLRNRLLSLFTSSTFAHTPISYRRDKPLGSSRRFPCNMARVSRICTTWAFPRARILHNYCILTGLLDLYKEMQSSIFLKRTQVSEGRAFQVISGNDQNTIPTSQGATGSKLDRTSELTFYGSRGI